MKIPLLYFWHVVIFVQEYFYSMVYETISLSEPFLQKHCLCNQLIVVPAANTLKSLFSSNIFCLISVVCRQQGHAGILAVRSPLVLNLVRNGRKQLCVVQVLAFLPCDALLARYMLSSCLSVCVCLCVCHKSVLCWLIRLKPCFYVCFFITTVRTCN